MWKASKDIAVCIYNSNSLKIQKDFGLKDQMQRAAVSISSNIAEGFERGSKTEFIQFLYISKGSCGELRNQLFIAKDIGYINEKEFGEMYSKCRIVSAQINGFIKYLKSSGIKGQKFQKDNQQI